MKIKYPITIPQAASQYEVSVLAIWRLIRHKKIHSGININSEVVVNSEELNIYVEKHTKEMKFWKLAPNKRFAILHPNWAEEQLSIEM